MSVEYFRRLPYGQKIWHVASNPNAAMFAYERLALHATSAELQMTRIWEAARQSRVPPPATIDPAKMHAYLEEARRRVRPVLSEVHFYFVAWANCGRMLKVLTGEPAFLSGKRVFDSHKKDFEHYTHGRNSFEHFHDRLPGQRDARRVKEVQDGSAGPRRVFFGLKGETYTHSDQVWDISPRSLTLLNEIIAKVTALVHEAADRLIEERFGGEKSGGAS